MEHWTWSRAHPSRAHEKDIKANLDKRICLLSASSSGSVSRRGSGRRTGTRTEPGQYEDRCKRHTHTDRDSLSNIYRKCLPLYSVSVLLLMGYISCPAQRPASYVLGPSASVLCPWWQTHEQLLAVFEIRMHFKVGNKNNSNRHNYDNRNKVVPEKYSSVGPWKGLFLVNRIGWTFGSQIKDTRRLVGKLFKSAKHASCKRTRDQ